MAAWDPHSESRVGAEVGAVPEDVPDADHAPVSAAPCLQAFFVEASGDQPNAHVLVDIEAIDIADHDRFFWNQLEAAAAADFVAERRPSQHLSLHRLLAHRRAHSIAEIRCTLTR